jgi:hypothetical protein
MDMPSTPSAPLFALTRFHACSRFSREGIRSSRFSSGLADSTLCPTVTPPVGLNVSWELMETPTPFSVFGPSPCPPHYGRRLASMTSADFCPVTSLYSGFLRTVPRGSALTFS